MLVVSMDQSSGKKGKDMSNVECWNCREKCYFRNKCPKPKKSKASLTTPMTENPKTKTDVPAGTANIVKEVLDKEGAWAAEELDCDETCMESDCFDEAIIADYANCYNLQLNTC